MTMPIETAQNMLQEQFPGMIVDWNKPVREYCLETDHQYLMLDKIEHKLIPVTFTGCREIIDDEQRFQDTCMYLTEYCFHNDKNNMRINVLVYDLEEEVDLYEYSYDYCCK